MHSIASYIPQPDHDVEISKVRLLCASGRPQRLRVAPSIYTEFCGHRYTVQNTAAAGLNLRFTKETSAEQKPIQEGMEYYHYFWINLPNFHVTADLMGMVYLDQREAPRGPNHVVVRNNLITLIEMSSLLDDKGNRLNSFQDIYVALIADKAALVTASQADALSAEVNSDRNKIELATKLYRKIE